MEYTRQGPAERCRGAASSVTFINRLLIQHCQGVTVVTEVRFPVDQQPSSESAPAPDTQTFEWTQQWYPVAVVEFLDPSRPHPIQLLGQHLVIWQDGTGRWRCFNDACPHRLAPLSEGRVEADGSLMCAYHAWRFDAQGNCISLPQSRDPETEAKHCARPQACTVAYPTQERQGLLWVWAESGPQAEANSQQRAPRLIPELEAPSDQVVKLFWYVRDLPYGWDSFMENIADPAHVPVSHHGIFGSRYEDAQYYDMPQVRDISTQEGFAYAVTPTPPTLEQAVHDFQPPCHMRICSSFSDGGKFILGLYASPTRPGWCRHIGCQVLVKNKAGKTPKGLAFFALPMPTWLGHVLASLFLHQDLVFLHYQEKTLAQRRPAKWLDAVYTPNPQDKMVIALRQWLRYRAGGGIPWAAGCDPALPPAEQDKQALFDVWSTHTQHCSVCRDALQRIKRITGLTYVGAVVCLVLGVMVDARAMALHAATQGDSALFTVLPPAGFWGRDRGGDRARHPGISPAKAQPSLLCI